MQVLDSEIIELLEFMLQICPSKRPTAEQVLAHSFFADVPEQVDFIELSALIEENKFKPKYGKPKPRDVLARDDSDIQMLPKADGETVDLTQQPQKPSLLGKRTSDAAGFDQAPD